MVTGVDNVLGAERTHWANRWIRGLMGLTLLAMVSAPPLRAGESTQTGDVLFDLSLEELMDVEVVSSARQPQAASRLSVPVTVITAQDIHYRGCTNVAEALALVPGIDLLTVDRNRYAVGIRGLHHSLAARTLVLINGRNAGNPIYGACDFTRLPLFVEDIDRIEVVRGPGGAAWGANAFNGVINILTKKPEDVQNGLVSATLNEFGDYYTHARWGRQQGPLSWRLSAGNKDQESSEDAINDDDFEFDDFSRNVMFDGEGRYQVTDSVSAVFGAAYADIERGTFDFTGLGTGVGNEQIDSTRLFARLEKQYDDGATGYLQWAGNFDNEKRPSAWDARSSENDLEVQWNFAPAESHELSLGGNLRLTRINTEWSDPSVQLDFPDNPFDELRAGLFLIDRWQPSEQLTLEGQIRGDTSSEANEDWSARFSTLYALDNQKDHMARLSVARAYREPLALLRESEYIIPPPGFGFDLVKADHLKNEQIVSLELGYTWQIRETLRFQADGYYQRYRDLIGQVELAPLPTGERAFANIDGGDAYGGEIQLTWEHKRVKVTAWYAYNDFDPDLNEQSIRAFGPAKQKMGLSGRLFLEDDWTINADFKAVTSTPWYTNSAILTDIESYNALDLTCTKRLGDGDTELTVGVTDLLDETGFRVRESGGTTYPTPGRTFFIRMQFRF